jgi:cholera toxin transcriptional activator
VPPQPTSDPHRNLRFGLFELDRKTGELRKRGTRLRLQEQPFRVLAMLVERPGDLVTREELREKLWPEDTFVDFDHGLNTSVNKLRETLGDSAANPRFIETLPKRGYRFIAPIEPDVAESQTASEVVPPEKSGGSELPKISRELTRTLFLLAQVMYLSFYVAALVNFPEIQEILAEWTTRASGALTVLVIVTALAGIPIRFFFLTAVGFDYARFAEKYARLFPVTLTLDLLWAVSPLLTAVHIGLGIPLAVMAALLYLSFGQRTLVHMAYVS